MMQGTSPVVAGRNTSGGDFLRMIGSENTMSSVEGWKQKKLFYYLIQILY